MHDDEFRTVRATIVVNPAAEFSPASSDRETGVAVADDFCRQRDDQGCMTRSNSELIATALGRGLRKRCPHCGKGPLFSGWSFLDSCSVCGLVFARNAGDTWGFTIIGDRLPIGAMIVLIYFGVVRSHPVPGIAMLVALMVLAIWTAPNRWGASIALHYLSRVYWPDPADPIPPTPAADSQQ